MIKLREFIESDAESLAENANNPNVSRYLREVFPYPYTLEAAKWWVAEGYKLGNSLNLAIDLNGKCIGGAGFNFFENELRYSCEMGYWLGENHWGKGYATEVIALLKKMAFSNYEVARLYAPVVGDNVASKRVLEKNEFVLEGVLKKHLFLRGAFYDECIYATYS
ncbi:MAG: GNAT family protein [Paraglaciecola sp.]|uniref:GNAT family N-acetyltransferase n=1 Tax=Paraglaciecola sp. TaxID=1920173 RepID=UPI00329785A0